MQRGIGDHKYVRLLCLSVKRVNNVTKRSGVISTPTFRRHCPVFFLNSATFLYLIRVSPTGWCHPRRSARVPPH